MYSLLCVFISQYSNKVDFISMGEAQMGEGQRGSQKLWDPGPMLPLEPPLIDEDINVINFEPQLSNEL